MIFSESVKGFYKWVQMCQDVIIKEVKPVDCTNS